jgi:hypothetical protein
MNSKLFSSRKVTSGNDEETTSIVMDNALIKPSTQECHLGNTIGPNTEQE